jgi:hypothetical protein
LLLVGALIGNHVLGGLSIGELWGYLDHGKSSDPQRVGERLVPVIANGGFVWAYGLVLLGFALLYRLLAFSRVSSRFAGFVVMAVVVTVIADVALRQVRSWTPSTALSTGIEAAYATRWCALFVALIAVPAVVGILARGAMSRRLACAWRFRQKHPIVALYLPPPVLRWLRSKFGEAPATVGSTSDSQAKHREWWEAASAESVAPRGVESPTSVAESRWFSAFHVPGAQDVIDHREKRKERVQALCLSGGGVRSACAGMGAMQTFSEEDAVDRTGVDPTQDTPKLIDGLDYIISVSGGGYSAGARLLAVQSKSASTTLCKSLKARVRRGLSEGRYRPPELGAAINLSDRFQPGSAEFDHLRRGSSYISDSPAGLVRALLEVLKNVVASLVAILTIPVIVGWVAGWVLASTGIAAFPPLQVRPEIQRQDRFPSLDPHAGAYWAIGFFALISVLALMAALVAEWGWWGRGGDWWRSASSLLAGAFGAFAALVGVITVVLPALMHVCWSVTNAGVNAQSSVVAGVSGVVGLNFVAAVVAIGRKNQPMLSLATATTHASRLKRALPPALLRTLLVAATLGALLIVWLTLLGCVAAAVFHFNVEAGGGPHVIAVPHWKWWITGLFATVLFIGFADVTSMSLHPFYRRRLARTFAVRRKETCTSVHAERYPTSEHTWLHTYRSKAGGPKFVFAAAAAITGADKPAPGLNAVSYVMSADYMGGPELGWLNTAELWQAAPPRIKRDMTVEAAVAVSGAAIASSMGRMDRGVEKLLAITGARLGTWLPNPRFVDNLAKSRENLPKSLPSIRGGGYLYREILGINNKDARLVQVTDGGHYDNSGLVEALRRRCGFIICVDGGGDAPPLATGLADAIRLAEYELGVTITLKMTGEYSLENIAPGSGKQFDDDDAFASLKTRLSRGTVVSGMIKYPPCAGYTSTHGTLIFAKAVLTQQCPAWLLAYAASKDGLIFPHDPTSDQWFTEAQFAAYTELGRIMADEVLKCAADPKTYDPETYESKTEASTTKRS